MPDNTPSNTPVVDPAANNAEVAKKLAEQDQSLKPSAAVELKATDDALDALAKEVEAKATAKPEEKPAAPAPDVAPKPEDKPGTPPAAETPPPIEDPHKKRADELFKDSPTLPTNASPKSSEAFQSVKIKAAQEISKLELKLSEQDKKLAEMEEKLKNPISADVQKEIEDLRTFKARLDIEADPKFREFDSSISRTREFVYAQLLQNPKVNETTIEAIKKHGGPEMVNLDKLFEQLGDPALRRIVDTAITQIEQAKFNKAEAIKTAKANVQQYVQERQQAIDKSVTHHNEQTQQELNKLTKQMAWLNPQTVDEKADQKTREAVEASNKFVTEIQEQMNVALKDDSYEMRAILIAGMAQLLNLQRVHAGVSSENGALKKQVAELEGKLAAIKSASTARLREGGAAPGAKAEPSVKQIDQFNTRAVDALDSIRDQVVAERARAAGQ